LKGSRLLLAATVGFAALLGGVSPAAAQVAPSLGAAEGFAVLAGSTVTNAGASVITGDLGVSPGSAVTGFPPGTVSGSIYIDATALAAQGSVLAAYNDLAGEACTTDLTGQDLGGLTLTPGVHCFTAAAQLTGPLTLDAQGNPDAVFIFQIGSALTTATASSVSVINGGSRCNVFWQVGSAATLGTGTSFGGNILASTSITLNTGASLVGRALARSGAVTLASNAVGGTCTLPPPPVCPTITLAPATLPGGTVAVAYAQTLLGSGGLAPYSFGVTAGTLPAGLTLTSAGVLAGTPTAAGSSVVTIRGTDANGCFASVVYTIVIAAAPPPPPVCPTITLAPATLPGGTVAVAYAQTLLGSGGLAPYSFGVTAGALPTGVTLTTAGALAGTPASAGTSTFTIRGTAANACFAEVVFTMLVPSAVPTLPQGLTAFIFLGLIGWGCVRLRRKA
jgi:type VI secretion system secreted protein VgrG